MDTFRYVAVLVLSSGTHQEVHAWGMRTEAACRQWQVLYDIGKQRKPGGEWDLHLCLPWKEFRRLHPLLPLQDS